MSHFLRKNGKDLKNGIAGPCWYQMLVPGGLLARHSPCIPSVPTEEGYASKLFFAQSWGELGILLCGAE